MSVGSQGALGYCDKVIPHTGFPFLVARHVHVGEAAKEPLPLGGYRAS